MTNPSGDRHYRAPHARPDSVKHVELSPEPAEARRQLARELGDRWPGDLPGVQLAVSEALVNASRHAGGTRRAEAWVNGASVVIQVCDRGRGFDPSPYVSAPPDAMAERGRGLWLISRLADSCELQQEAEGGRLVLRFQVGNDAMSGGPS